MTSGPVVYLVLTGEDVIDIVRKMVGATKAADAVPGTIRGDLLYLEQKISFMLLIPVMQPILRSTGSFPHSIRKRVRAKNNFHPLI